MTAEAAYTKWSHLLGTKKDKDEIADLNADQSARRAEKQSIFNLHFGNGEIGEDEDSFTVYQLKEMVDNKKYNVVPYDKAFLRIMGVTEHDGSKNDSARGKIILN